MRLRPLSAAVVMVCGLFTTASVGTEFVLPLPDSSTARQASNGPMPDSEMKKLRQQTANRQRRIVYNDDGCHGTPGNTAEDWLACRIRQVTHTQVDTICYCTGGGGVFWAHQPKVGEVLGTWVEEGHGQYVKQMRDTLIAMKKLGTDPLAVVVDYAHQHHQEVPY